MNIEIADGTTWDEALTAKRSKYSNIYLSFYSSYLNLITTDVTHMSIPIDDHLVHRGHGVYDTGTVKNGRLYEFRRHVGRLIRSAEKAEIKNLPWTADDIISITRQTISAAASAADCSVRLFISAGPGGFSITSAETEGPCLYIMCYKSVGVFPVDPYTPIKEATVSTSVVPMKEVTGVKSVNYELNTKMATEAKLKGGFLGLWVDSQGYVTEGSVNNFAIVSNGEFITPPFEGILAGCTMQHILEIIDVPVVRRKVKIEEVYQADELMITGGDTHVFGVVQLDGKQIADGLIGRVTRSIIERIQQELETGESCDSIKI